MFKSLIDFLWLNSKACSKIDEIASSSGVNNDFSDFADFRVY